MKFIVVHDFHDGEIYLNAENILAVRTSSEYNQKTRDNEMATTLVLNAAYYYASGSRSATNVIRVNESAEEVKALLQVLK